MFVYYLGVISVNYRQLRSEEASFIIKYERETVGRSIYQIEQSALFISLLAGQAYRSGRTHDDFGSYVSLDTINAIGFNEATGSGIWFEPYTIIENAPRVYLYLYNDPETNEISFVHEYENEEYDYHSQPWYVAIRKELKGPKSTVWTVWTEPYSDEHGVTSLMTTVGVGIYDDDDNLVGIATVDWQIQDVKNRLSAVVPTENSFVLLACPKDDYIISNTYDSDDRNVGKSLYTLPWYKELDLSGYYNNINGLIENYFVFDGVQYVSYSYPFENGWLLSMQIPVKEFFSAVDSFNVRYATIMGVSSVLLLLIIFYLTSKYVNAPLKKLTQGVLMIGISDLDKKIDINSKDEVGLLATAFNEMTDKLKESIEQNTREQAANARLGAELSVAAMIQANMLPCIFPPFPDNDEFDIFASMFPARKVGGDFYDFFFVDADTLAVVIADVSDKGIHSAMFMAIAKTLVKNIARYGKQGMVPEKVFENINTLLCEGNRAHMFVTAFMGYLNIKSGKFVYVNAGHNPPLVCLNNRYEKLKLRKELVLGIKEGIKYTQDQIELKPGNKLFLYTDGVTEAVNGEEELFREKRLLKIANDNIGLPPLELINLIKREIDGYASGVEQADDITMLALHYKGSKSAHDSITVQAKTDNLHTIIDFAQERIPGCPPKIKNKINIAIDEVFSNIVKFAYGAETGEVTVRVISDNAHLSLEFEDSGTAFNPLETPEPDISLPVGQRKIGGLGIFMLKKLMDTVEYRRENEKNILTIVKKLNPAK